MAMRAENSGRQQPSSLSALDVLRSSFLQSSQEQREQWDFLIVRQGISVIMGVVEIV